MRELIVENYIINASVEDIIYKLQSVLTNGKLRDVTVKDDNIRVTCPHHSDGKESVPACDIYVGEDDALPYGFCNCFVCGFKGPFVTFVSECFNCSKQRAIEWLIQNFDFKQKAISVNLGAPIQLKKTTKTQVKTLGNDVFKGYQNWCPYLAKRKLSRHICEQFKVKYDPVHRQVVFPCYDLDGNLVMAPKRSIDTKTFYLDKDVEKPVYCLDYIVKNNIKSAIITEGPFDCLTAYEYGMPACATLGKISDHQIEQLNKSGVNVLYAMFDNDQAGRSFTNILKTKLNKRIIVIDVRIPNPYKDINDMSREDFEKIFAKYKNSSISIV